MTTGVAFLPYDMKQLEKLAEKTLSEKRFYHTRCVAERAARLATLYGCDVQKAETAGWLHDICKELPREAQLQWLTKYGIILDSIQKGQPKTWHGMAACGFMKLELGILDPEILHAVRYHTTACGNMTKLDEVVYLADLTGIDRRYPDADKMRALAEQGLRPAMKEAMRFAVGDLVERSLGISPDTYEAYNFYVNYSKESEPKSILEVK